MEDRIYYKNLRISKNLSLRSFSALTGIHYQQIRRYENGEINLNNEQIKKIQEILQCIDPISNAKKKKAVDIFFSFYADICYDKVDLNYYMNQIPTQFINIDEELVYLVIRYIIYILQSNLEESMAIEKKLLKFKLDNELIAVIYTDYKGCRLFLSNQHQKALELYRKLLSQNYTEKVDCMIQFHFALVCKDLNRLNDALNAVRKAKNLFDKMGNVRRLFGCAMLIAGIELRMRDYYNAEIDYNNCISFGEVIGIEKSEIAKVYRNLVWLMIKKKDYNLASYYLEKARIIEGNHSLVHRYNIWINYKKKNYNLALNEIRHCKIGIADNEFLMLLNFFEQLCYLKDNKPSNKLVNEAIKVYKVFKKKNDVDLSLFYIDIVIELLKRKSDEKILILYLNEKIILLEN